MTRNGKANGNGVIDPAWLAFDIDGVVADTMEIFVQLARDRYGLNELSKEDLRCYDLHQCLDLDRTIVDDLICLTLDDEHTLMVPPMVGAPDVLTELAQRGPLRFVTARIWPESITQWLEQTLPDVSRDRIQVIATGAPEAKLEILRDLDVRFFLEDRVETCRLLSGRGIQPLLFDQPWNRDLLTDEFPRICNWEELRQWVLP
jgi:uncharacterized protein